MLFAPDSRLLRKAWFDKVFAAEQDDARKAELDAKFSTLPESDALRCLSLTKSRSRSISLATENPAFTVDLLSGELGKLGAWCARSSSSRVTCARYEEYLKSVDFDEIERDCRRYQQIVERADGRQARAGAKESGGAREAQGEVPGDPQLLVVGARPAGADREHLPPARRSDRHHASPKSSAGQLDELMDGVEAVRQTTRETDKLLQAIER